jgi:hypothetical protein
MTETDDAVDLFTMLLGRKDAARRIEVDKTILEHCLVIYASAGLADRRGWQAGWSYSETAEPEEALREVLLTNLVGKDTQCSLSSFRATLQQSHRRRGAIAARPAAWWAGTLDPCCSVSPGIPPVSVRYRVDSFRCVPLRRERSAGLSAIFRHSKPCIEPAAHDCVGDSTPGRRLWSDAAASRPVASHECLDNRFDIVG